MNEQFRNRKHASIKSLLQKGELLVFSDQQNDGINITNMNITTSSFLRLGMKEASLNNCSFTQSNFEHCYFRNAKFNTVRFTGSCFIHCNFDKATFQSCDFRYCSFYFCKLPKEEIISCLPPESNLKCDLARNLRMNSEMIGDKKTADEFLKIEIRAGEEERKAIFLSKTQYYKDRYNWRDQFRELLKYVASKFSGLIWGYGHRIDRLLISLLLLTLMFSLITYFGKISFIESGTSLSRSLGILESLYFTFCNTVSVSALSFEPMSFSGKLIVLLESFFGIVYLALLAATLYRRIAR